MCPTIAGTEERASLWRDLRCGEVGLLPRLALSLVAALALIAIAVLVLAMAEVLMAPVIRSYSVGPNSVRTYAYSPISDKHIAIAMSGATVLWLVSLIRIWGTYPRFRNVLRTVFGVLAISVATIMLCMLLANTMPFEGGFLIVACILGGIGGSILLVTAVAYRVRRGKNVFTAEGHVNVNCPSCGYSMVGLEQSRCPECGSQYTLDELIRRQDYANVKRLNADPARTALQANASGDA
ncbi:MAG: hypothetical protein JXB13_13875 [Phycisphaerae bacterium]|nr:hypothetical protein [Phycisphaerae bacterium]